MTELGDVYREDGGLVGVLRNAKLMKNLGRLYVADAVLGNGDRLDALNTGNIAFDGSGSVFAIDSGTVLGSFEQLIKDCTLGGTTWQMTAKNPTKPSADVWAGQMFAKNAMVASPNDKQVGTAVDSKYLTPAARMDMLFDPPKVFEHFKNSSKTTCRTKMIGGGRIRRLVQCFPHRRRMIGPRQRSLSAMAS